MSPPSHSRSSWSRISLFALVLVVAIAVNVAQYSAVNEAAGRNYTALQRYQATDLAEIGYSRSGIRGRYGIHFALAELAPGARVLVATRNGKLRRELGARLHSFGRVAELVPVGRDLSERILADLHGFDPVPYVVASDTRGERDNPWLIAAESPGAFGPANAEVLEDPKDLLSAPWQPGAARQPQLAPTASREFILLSWELPHTDLGDTAVDLLLETSLLPEVVRKDLPH